LQFHADAQYQTMKDRRNQAMERAQQTRDKADLKKWEDAYNAHDKYIRAKISAASNLTGKDKKAMLEELDKAWSDTMQDIQALQRGQTPYRKGTTRTYNPQTDKFEERALGPND